MAEQTISQSAQGGRGGTFGRSTGNPQADGLMGCWSESDCKLFI